MKKFIYTNFTFFKEEFIMNLEIKNTEDVVMVVENLSTELEKLANSENSGLSQVDIENVSKLASILGDIADNLDDVKSGEKWEPKVQVGGLCEGEHIIPRFGTFTRKETAKYIASVKYEKEGGKDFTIIPIEFI
jgi:hypothetical protein